MRHHRFLVSIVFLLLLVGVGCVDGKVTKTGVGSSGTPAAGTSVSTARLDLSGKDLQNVPADVFTRTALEELDLSNNRLTGALPGEIRFLKNLTVLDLSENRMTGVPAEIGQLSQLLMLDLSNNQLTGLPLELGNLQRLRRLDLRGNNVSKRDLDEIRARLRDTDILE